MQTIDNIELLVTLTEISNLCIGDLTMGYKLDAQAIGEMIGKATGMNNPDLNTYTNRLVDDRIAQLQEDKT